VRLRVRRDADAFAHVDAGGQLEEVGDRLEWDFRRRGLGLRRRSAALGERHAGAEKQRDNDERTKASHHVLP